MKRIIMIFTSMFAVGLSACNDGISSNIDTLVGNENSNEESSSGKENLFKYSEIEEGYWVTSSGDKSESEDMIISNPITYDPNSEYEMNKTAYVTYMKDDEVITTILHSDGPAPIEIENVEGANQVRISFDKSKLDGFELIMK